MFARMLCGYSAQRDHPDPVSLRLGTGSDRNQGIHASYFQEQINSHVDKPEALKSYESAQTILETEYFVMSAFPWSQNGCNLPKRRVESSSGSVTCDRSAWNENIGRLVRRIIILFINKNVHEITEVLPNLARHSYVECLEYVIGIAIGAEFLMNIYNTGCSCTDTPDVTRNCLSELLLKSSSKRQKTDVFLGICSLSVTFFLPPSCF